MTASMEAPVFSSNSMTRIWFFLQAMCKGVKPFCSPTQRETGKQGLTLKPKDHPDHPADEKAAPAQPKRQSLWITEEAGGSHCTRRGPGYVVCKPFFQIKSYFWTH